MSIDHFVCDAFSDWLGATFDSKQVRLLEQGVADQGAAIATDWQKVVDSGFADLLVDENAGGAGADLATAGEVLQTCGACALPLALATTLWVRAALAREGHGIPQGAIGLACGKRIGAGVICSGVAFGTVVDWVLVVLGDDAWLLSMYGAQQATSVEQRSLSVDLAWPAIPVGTLKLEHRYDWQAIGAAIFAALIAGAARSVLQLSLAYAAERSQFGKPIGRFQAVQQQLSVLAEEVYAVRMAAQLALRGTDLQVDPHLAALAKARASQAVPNIVAIGHMVHGAIGITEEYDLQLHTRRLHEWRLQFGSERYWQRRLGEALLDSELPVLDFMRALTEPG
ncbi:acyl-CoA dehydrogenase family protein [Pseudomonas sp.]|jgi:acyl-CoA dehydrogenase|uniref:acyl-CoA dehydrogenase family protein n=1 Tax=Pseudomonas sp. TaxID=306 RepID=UPI002604A7E9|nr:acyl-CoA dehydrogenase family protein [Pseudomonas sp.]